ncbi:MAG: hypothetical protein WCP92_08530 [bacterium]
MNTLQNIFATILKAMYFDVFATGLTESEEKFIENFMSFHYSKNLKLEKTLDGKFVIMWNSSLGKTIACHITDVGCFFSNVEVYNEKERSMSCSIKYNFPDKTDAIAIVNEEIEEIKTLFMTYSIDVEVYFK